MADGDGDGAERDDSDVSAADGTGSPRRSGREATVAEQEREANGRNGGEAVEAEQARELSKRK